jgi:hypothetical protein
MNERPTTQTRDKRPRQAHTKKQKEKRRNQENKTHTHTQTTKLLVLFIHFACFFSFSPSLFLMMKLTLETIAPMLAGWSSLFILISAHCFSLIRIL